MSLGLHIADKLVKEGVNLPLQTLGVSHWLSYVMCSPWESVFGKGVEMRVHAKWDQHMTQHDAKVSSGPVLNVMQRWSIQLKTQGKAHKRKDNPPPGEELSDSDAHQIKHMKRAVAPSSPLAEELSA
ncbi:hypothetical protein BS47DRAFT_1364292 [Hydnum rufescens UP504]|uniref:Uncharacterized protein n=1 Tax=Hydnum rufescens UP504 TaxID=1448309 RepID=A0A9P6DQ60_9AGAM|nr:hypothetical protein BS47DRAFT_1364292 [Hydnum rufescens UP504]